jgi:four helix bundle protein
MSNMAEGFERGGDVEFRRFLLISKGSAGQVRAQLYVALDAGMIDKVQFDSLYKLSIDVASLIAGLIRYLNKKAASHP